MTTIPNKELPHSVEAEKAVLGAMLIAPETAVPETLASLQPEDFYIINHRIIFGVMAGLYEAKEPVDMVGITQRLAELGKADDIPPAQLSELMMFCPSVTNLDSYVQIVLEKSRSRKLIQLSHELLVKAYEPDFDSTAACAEYSVQISKVATSTANIISMKEAVADAMVSIERIMQSSSHVSGLSTGFEKIDQFTTGLNAPELWVIAGRPGLGKTAIAMNMAENVARKGSPVGVITMEQSAMALAKRVLAARSSINMRKLRYITPDQQESLVSEAINAKKLPIYFDQRPALTGAQIRATARSMAHRHDCKLFIIDYLQLGTSDNKRSDRQNQIAELSGQIKAMAKELNVPVILLSQLNRASVIGNRRPTLADLRDSGAIEQDADLVAFLNADLQDDELPEAWQGRLSEPERSKLIQFSIEKQREGETVAAYLRFDRELTCFENFAMPTPQQ